MKPTTLMIPYRPQYPRRSGNSLLGSTPVAMKSLVWGVVRTLIAFGLVAWATAAQTKSPAPKAAEKAAPKGAAPAVAARPPAAEGKDAVKTPFTGEIVLVPSVFEINAEYKDPFYPKSDRPTGILGDPSSTNTNPSFVKWPEMRLKAVSIVQGKRLAMLNQYTFAVGEERAIKVNNQSYQVRCDEIRENSAVFSLMNQSREFFLGEKPASAPAGAPANAQRASK